MITKAVKDGDEWVVTGTKNWISNLGIADFYIVFAKTDPSAGALARHQRLRGRGRPPRVLRRQGRAQARHQGLAHRPADLRRRPDSGSNLIGSRGQGHERRARHARPLAPRRRRPGRRHRPGRDRPRRRLRQRAQAVRPGDLRVPGHPVQARRHGDAHGGRARAALPRLGEDRPPRARRRQVLGDGEAVRVRHGDGGVRRGRPGARRLRLRQRVPGRALHARRQDHADLRGHQRDPASRDRQRSASGSLGRHASRWPTGRSDRLHHGALPRGRARPSTVSSCRACRRCGLAAAVARRCWRSSSSAARSRRSRSG